MKGQERFEGLSVILADDDPAIQDSVTLMLEREGFSVSVHPNGSLLLDGHFAVPDILLLDRLLPGIDGLDVCKALKNRPATAEVPIIMLSASPHIGRMAKEVGADDFLEKPFSKRQLISKLAEHIRH